MPLTAGAHLGPYEILSPLGAGGMGEVYKARDTRLDRTIAIKILPDTLASDPQFRERFDREARAISQLTHPHICTLYDVGEQQGTAYLVMEYLDGETLEQRLKKGALPLDQALKLAIEIADALSAAHRRGIVHRDLKPGNVMLTKSGAKLLDFGLAKTGTPSTVMANFSMLPTTPPLTAHGTILGTFQYMAPEQLEGHDADARTDIFAFGALVYEMVTGRRAFEGKTQASLIAAILEREPPTIASLQPVAPATLDRLVRTCLAKSPDDRWQTAHDLLREIRWVAENRAERPGASSQRSSRREAIAWTAAAFLGIVAVAALIATVMYVRSVRSAATAPETRFEISATGSPFLMAISPDGRSVAYVAPSDTGVAMLWVRPLNSLDARMLAGTNGAQSPDWSPDGRFIVFGVPREAKVKKIDVAGGPAQTLADLRGGYTRSTWNREGTILFGVNGGGIRRVSASGGEAPAITELDASLGEIGHNTPWFLPDGRHFLYTAWSSQPENRAIYVGSLDSNTRKRLMTAESKALYAPPGFILFLRSQTLMARRFDANRLEFTGEAVPVAEDVAYNPQLGQSAFYASDEGTLIYRKGSVVQGQGTRQWVWMDRTGKPSGTIQLPLNVNADLRLSPDGKHVACFEGGLDAFVLGGGSADIWLYDLDRNLTTRLTADAAPDGFPVWSPDGTRLVFSSRRGNAGTALYEKPSNAAGPERIVFQPESGTVTFARDWSLDGRFVVFETFTPLGPSRPRRDLWMLPMSGERKPSPYLATSFDEMQPVFSPNGKWLAYVSNDARMYQVVVQPFPDPSSGKWQISTNGGVYPRWSRDGRELYYLDPQRRIVAVSVAAEGGFKVGKTTPLFETALEFPAGQQTFASQTSVPYDVSADGQRFLISVRPDQSPTTSSTPIKVVLHWQAALTAREK
jgi:Tol biopolymer transport system component